MLEDEKISKMNKPSNYEVEIMQRKDFNQFRYQCKIKPVKN